MYERGTRLLISHSRSSKVKKYTNDRFGAVYDLPLGSKIQPGSTRAPRAANQRSRCSRWSSKVLRVLAVAVSFQRVVHSAPAVNALSPNTQSFAGDRMDTHKNAPLTPKGREAAQMASMVCWIVPLAPIHCQAQPPWSRVPRSGRCADSTTRASRSPPRLRYRQRPSRASCASSG